MGSDVIDTDVGRSDGTDASRPGVNFVKRGPGRQGGPHHLCRCQGAVSHTDDRSPQLFLNALHIRRLDRTIADAHDLVVDGLLQVCDGDTWRWHSDDR